VIPLSDRRRAATLPWVTWALAALNVAVVAYLVWRGGSLFGAFGTPVAEQVALNRGFTPAALTADPLSLGVWLTVLSSAFIHGGWLHVAVNMIFLLVFGDDVEERFGHLGFLAFYITAAFAAGLAQWAADPASVVPVIGASGAVSAVLGAALLLRPRGEVVTLVPVGPLAEIAAIPAWVLALVFFAGQIALAIEGWGGAPGTVAVYAHVGGFLFGAAVAAPVAIADRFRVIAERRRSRRSAPRRRRSGKAAA
jgi:membrane associated rhomboid family serine protease